MPKFPSMKAAALVAILEKEPLGYSIVRQKGSHRTFRAKERPQILFSYHDGATVPPGVVRKILVKQIGLSEEDALELL